MTTLILDCSCKNKTNQLKPYLLILWQIQLAIFYWNSGPVIVLSSLNYDIVGFLWPLSAEVSKLSGMSDHVDCSHPLSDPKSENQSPFHGLYHLHALSLNSFLSTVGLTPLLQLQWPPYPSALHPLPRGIRTHCCDCQGRCSFNTTWHSLCFSQLWLERSAKTYHIYQNALLPIPFTYFTFLYGIWYCLTYILRVTSDVARIQDWATWSLYSMMCQTPRTCWHTAYCT